MSKLNNIFIGPILSISTGQKINSYTQCYTSGAYIYDDSELKRQKLLKERKEKLEKLKNLKKD